MKQRKEVRREVTIKLKDEELLAKGQQAAALSKDRDDIDVEFSAVKSSFKERLEEKDQAISAALTCIRDKAETSMQDVTELVDFEANSITILIGDRVIEERALTGDERQIQMFPADKKGPSPQGELPLQTPGAIDLNNVHESWTVALPDPDKREGDQDVYVPGEPDRPTIVRFGALSWRLEPGEAASFGVTTEEVFGNTIKSWEKRGGSTVATEPPQPTATTGA